MSLLLVAQREERGKKECRQELIIEDLLLVALKLVTLSKITCDKVVPINILRPAGVAR